VSIKAKLRRAPMRLAAGTYILNAGLGKVGSSDEEQAKGIHGMATGAYPFLGKVDPKVFVRSLGALEVTVGSVLLLPIVPAGLAGLALCGFSGALLTMYVRTPFLHDDKMRPTQQGTAIAKDVWMAGIGASLVIDAVLSENTPQEEA
jgi:hypothetical protein